jgi:hypothetical protein
MHDTGLSPEVEFIFISSYGAGTTSGEVQSCATSTTRLPVATCFLSMTS